MPEKPIKKTGTNQGGGHVTGSQTTGNTNRNIDKAKRIIIERAKKKDS